MGHRNWDMGLGLGLGLNAWGIVGEKDKNNFYFSFFPPFFCSSFSVISLIARCMLHAGYSR